jgi:hypothetical protein
MHKGRVIPKNSNIKVPLTPSACKYTAFKAQNYRGTERNTFLYIKKQNDKNSYKIRLDAAKSFGHPTALFAATQT